MAYLDKISVGGTEYDIQDSKAARQTEVDELRNDIESITPGLSDDAIAALLNLLSHVAYVDENGQSYYDTLSQALGENFYDKWTWRLSSEELYVGNNSVGYDATSQQLFIGNHPNNDSIRRHAYVMKGVKPFKDGTSDTDTIYYPIPIPPTASKVKLTISPNIQASMNICKLNGDSWVRIVDTGWKAVPNEVLFDASANQVLLVNMRADANNTAFTSETEPTEIAIEFGIDDFYDRWRWEWNGIDDELVKQNRSSGYTASDRQVYVGSANTPSTVRRNFLTLRGKRPTQYTNNGGASGYYLIPIPKTANKFRVTCAPSGLQIAPAVMQLNGDGWDQLLDCGWQSMPFEATFASGENLELRLSLRVNANNAEFSSATEPISFGLEFMEV